jgi:hypothetical protein
MSMATTEGAFNLAKADWRRALRGRARTLDQFVDVLAFACMCPRRAYAPGSGE